jgi:hypothetical protein
VATGGAPHVLSERKQLGVLACSVTLHRLNSRSAATRRSRPVMYSITRRIHWVHHVGCGVPLATCVQCGLTGAVEVTEAIRRITLSR